jgi:hypothetical protein
VSNGLNAAFKASPVNFLTAHLNIQSSNFAATRANGTPIYNYTLDPHNVGSFNIVPGARVGTTNLSQHDGSIFTESAIKAYYLNARTDQTEQIGIANRADYFFTDTITGCAFIAWGTSRAALTVCHINALNLGKTTYMKKALEVRALKPAFLIIYSYQDYQKGVLAGEDPSMVVTTVCGKRLGDGWHFYTRSYIGIGGGAVGAGMIQPRGLQPTGVEIDPE